MTPRPSCFSSSCWTDQKSSSVKYPRPIPLWLVTMTSLKPADFSFGNSSATPSRSSTSPGLEQYPTSFIRVPSRSRKIAFCPSGLLLFISLIKTLQQLLWRECCRAQLADDHAACVIRYLCRFNRRGAGSQCEGEKPNGCVARSRQIVDFTSARRYVGRRIPLVKENHP